MSKCKWQKGCKTFPNGKLVCLDSFAYGTNKHPRWRMREKAFIKYDCGMFLMCVKRYGNGLTITDPRYVP